MRIGHGEESGRGSTVVGLHIFVSFFLWFSERILMKEMAGM